MGLLGKIFGSDGKNGSDVARVPEAAALPVEVLPPAPVSVDSVGLRGATVVASLPAKATGAVVVAAGGDARAPEVKNWVNEWLRAMDTEGVGANGASLSNAYQQEAWIYGCCNAIAQQVAHTPFRFSQGREGENVIESGPLVELFDQPHEYLNGFEFKELMCLYLLLRGKSFIVLLDGAGKPMRIDGADGGEVKQMLLLNPDYMTKVVSGKELQLWRYTGSNNAPLESQTLLPEEVLFTRLMHTGDFWEGMPPMAVASLAAQTDFAAAQFMKGLMLNNADTGVIVTTEQQPSEEQRTAIAAALKERKRKAGTADRPLFLWGGAKVEKPGITMADMQFLENRKFNRQEICCIFKVPQEILGFTEDANRSVSDSARLNFIENTIDPFCTRVELALRPLVQRVSRAEGRGSRKTIVGFFDVAGLPIMQRARRERFATAVSGFTMGVPIDALNDIFDLGLPKNLPHAGKSFLPYSLTEYGTDPTGDNGGNGDKPKPEDDDEEKGGATAAIDRLLAKATGPARIAAGGDARAPRVHVCAANPEYEASIAGSVKSKRGKISKFFFEQRTRVLSRLEDLTKAVQAGSPRYSRLETCATTKAFEDLLDLDEETRALMARLKPGLIADLEFGGAQLFREIGLDDFKLKPESAMEFLRVRENKLRDVNDATFNELQTSLEAGLDAGETFEELVDRVKEVFQDATDRRAETIALTETNTAVNSGRFKGMAQAGVERKGWKTANLDGVRATHRRAEQDYIEGIPLDQPFRVGAANLMHPCDPSGPPEEVINCRCFTFAILGEKGSPQRHGDTEKKFLTWEEFLTSKEPRKEGNQ